MELDKIDKHILNILQVDSKITNVALAEKINLSPASTLERVRKLEQHKIITHYYAQIDPLQVGFSVEIILGVKLQKMTAESIKLFKTTIDAIHSITTCYQVIGDFDFILMTHSRNIMLFQQTVVEKLYDLPVVTTIKSLYVAQLLKHKPIFLA
ncbi:MAG: Lrp/AsnC family transcriptional regulator [Amoebophilaceae bacterium]|nr:Lrp/AsnC family transcriptional regulator [Amoebophilaceae bacterium]